MGSAVLVIFAIRTVQEAFIVGAQVLAKRPPVPRKRPALLRVHALQLASNIRIVYPVFIALEQ